MLKYKGCTLNVQACKMSLNQSLLQRTKGIKTGFHIGNLISYLYHLKILVLNLKYMNTQKKKPIAKGTNILTYLCRWFCNCECCNLFSNDKFILIVFNTRKTGEKPGDLKFKSFSFLFTWNYELAVVKFIFKIRACWRCRKNRWKTVLSLGD